MISKIAFFPRFSPKKSVFSGHEWLQFEYRAKRDILEAISEPKYTDFAGGNGGKMQLCLSSITLTKKAVFSCPTNLLSTHPEGAWKSLQGRGKSHKVGGKVLFHAASTQKVRRTRKNSLL